MFVPNADIWNKCTNPEGPDMEIVNTDLPKQEDMIWPMLWFITFDSERQSQGHINKNLDDLLQIAKKYMMTFPSLRYLKVFFTVWYRLKRSSVCFVTPDLLIILIV